MIILVCGRTCLGCKNPNDQAVEREPTCLAKAKFQQATLRVRFYFTGISLNGRSPSVARIQSNCRTNICMAHCNNALDSKSKFNNTRFDHIYEFIKLTSACLASIPEISVRRSSGSVTVSVTFLPSPGDTRAPNQTKTQPTLFHEPLMHTWDLHRCRTWFSHGSQPSSHETHCRCK